MIYFIQQGAFVKIGTAGNVGGRVAQLQTGAPDELVLIGSMRGGLEEERELHERFRHLHHRGEWFFLNQELRHFIRLATKPEEQVARFLLDTLKPRRKGKVSVLAIARRYRNWAEDNGLPVLSKHCLLDALGIVLAQIDMPMLETGNDNDPLELTGAAFAV